MNYELMRVARNLWPRKTAAELASRAGISERSAEFWLAGKHAISIEAAQRLMQSEVGYEFLVPLMGDARPRWWEELKAGRDLAVLRRDGAALQRKLSGALEHMEQLELRYGQRLRD